MQEDARTKILNAAGPIFGEKGFQTATVREICEAAGVNVASINYHFGDKDSLYIETVRRAREMREAQVPMPGFSADMAAEDRLRIYVHTLLTRMTDTDEAPWQSQIMMREILQPTAACTEMVEEYIRPDFNLLLDILSGLMPEDTPHHVRQQIGFSVVGQCLFYRVAREIVGMLVSPGDRAEHYTVAELARHVSQLILASLGKSASIASKNENNVQRVAPSV